MLLGKANHSLLQVMNREGEYVDALPLAGTALINIGDFLAMCSNGQLKSTVNSYTISSLLYSLKFNFI